MTVVYEFTLSVSCPVDGTLDTYEATLTSPSMVSVEAINAQVAYYADKVIFQERLTEDMWHRLGCGGELTTVGTHSGVRVTVTVGGA